jgi:hypothetical protein
MMRVARELGKAVFTDIAQVPDARVIGGTRGTGRAVEQ